MRKISNAGITCLAVFTLVFASGINTYSAGKATSRYTSPVLLSQDRSAPRFNFARWRGIGTPRGRRRGAGSFAECMKREPSSNDLLGSIVSTPEYGNPLIALTPYPPVDFASLPDASTDVGPNNYVWAQALQDEKRYPTLWFYVPYASNSTPLGTSGSSVAELRLQDSSGQEIESWRFALPSSAGTKTISIKTASDRKAPEVESENITVYLPSDRLQAGKDYRWIFSIFCDPQERSPNDFVVGNLSLVSEPADLQAQLSARPAAYEVYAENGFWYETLTALRSNQEIWRQVVKEYVLDSLNETPRQDSR